MKRRQFLILGAAALSAPAIIQAQVSSGTPVVDGKRVRRRLSTLADDDPFFAAYALAIERMRALPSDSGMSWMSQARIHADHCRHGSLEFFPWHRPYLEYFELICGSLIGDPSFALPYWHWGDNEGRMPLPFFANDGLNVVELNDPSNYESSMWGPINTVPYRYARPDFGMADEPRVAGLFSEQALSNVVDAPTFDLLSGLTEAPHDAVHVFTGGNAQWGFGTAWGHFAHGLSPLDPIFWLHHSNVDRIWAQSGIDPSDQMQTLVDGGIDLEQTYSGMFFDQDGNRAAPLLADTFNLTDNFGYTYDFMAPGLQADRLRLIEEQTLSAQSAVMSIASSQGLDLPTQVPVLQRLGAVGVERPSVVGAINQIRVPVDNLAEVMTSERVVRRRLPSGRDAFAISGRRVYARLQGVTPREASDGNMLKVFVDCPYLSSAVPTTDPHFAGSVGFFGCPPGRCEGTSHTVDVTEPLRSLFDQGRLGGGEVTIQLLPFSGDGSRVGQTVATHHGLELLYI